MKCPTCGAQNLPNSAFCSQCATNLMLPPGLAGMPALVAPRTSGLAIAGFVLAFFGGLLGLIFSIIAYVECKRSNGAVGGKGLAKAGIVISIVMMTLTIVRLGRNL